MTPALLDISITGRPTGAARPRVVRARGGGVRTHMPDAHIAWEERARQIAAGWWAKNPPLDEPVCVEVVAWHHRPKRLCRRQDPREAIPATCKPDLDNVVKLALDSLVKAGVLVDDTRVSELRARRRYVPISETGSPLEVERVEVRVWTMEAAC